VNYPQDSDLRDVFFVSADEGWVVGSTPSSAGEGGILLHTTDGGQHWAVQMGDPHSAARIFMQLFFLDAKHGWATQAGNTGLLRTTDGETWEAMNEMNALTQFVFASPSVGFTLDGDKIWRTQDGGRTWKVVYVGRDKVEVNGLTQDVQCLWDAISCPTAQVCYAASQGLPDNSAAIASTMDGGLTWSISGHVPNASAGDWGLLFVDAKTGFMRGFADVWATVDGGQNWRKIPATFPGSSHTHIRFADREVGWLAYGNVITYTSDGGKRWNTMEVRFPATVYASSLPARDRGYVVGQHGMIYRYRIVPIEYTAKGMISVPAIAAR